MYKEKLIDSFKNLQFLLFIPDLIMFIFTFLLGISFIKYTGILGFFSGNSQLITSLETLLPILIDFIQNNFLIILIYLILFFIEGFIIGSGLIAMKFGLMKDVVEKKRLNIRKMWIYGVKYFWNVVWLRLTVFLIALFVIIIFGILVSLNALNPFYKSLFFIFISILFILTLIFLRFLLLFRYPALFFDRKSPIETIKNLYYYLFKNFRHVLIIWAIIFIIGLIVVLIDVSLSKVYLTKLLVFIIVIRSIINLVYSVWSNLFLFYMYKLD